MLDAPVRFGIPLQLGWTITKYTVKNGNVYIRHYSVILVDVGELYPQVYEYLAWCHRNHLGEHRPLRTFDIPIKGQDGIDPQCPDGEIVDPMDEAKVSTSDGTGPVDWEMDTPEQMEADKELEPMEQDSKRDGQVEDKDPEEVLLEMYTELESEPKSMDFEEDQESSESSSNSSGSDPD